MVRIVRIKNTGADGTWAGQTILAGMYHDLSAAEMDLWATKDQVFIDISSGRLMVNRGVDVADDITSAVEGWSWLISQQDMPISDMDGRKLAVHSSPKPSNNGNTIYVLWMGAGDDMATGEIGGGDILEFDMVPGLASKQIDIRFHANNGKIWLHEGYVKFMNGGPGDYINASVVGEGTPLQQFVNLDLVVTGDVITYSPGGPGTGTHGFADADAVILGGRGFSMDGDWDYDGVSLTPNMSGTGEYRISTSEQVIHRFMHKVPVRGTATSYVNLSSEESTLIPPHYFVRIEAHNTSDTAWYATTLIETYRERTFNP